MRHRLVIAAAVACFAATGQQIFEHLGRPFEAQRGLRFPLRDFDAAELRVVHPMEQLQSTAGVDDRNDHGPSEPDRFGFSRGNDPLRKIE